MQSHRTSPLLALPPELRNMIYEYVPLGRPRIDIASEKQPGLVRSCKEIRSESLQMYYTRNTFRFSPGIRSDEALKPLEQWLTRIGPTNCKCLRQIVIWLNIVSGSLITNFKSPNDAWTSLSARIAVAGCKSRLRIVVELHRDLRPNASAFKEGLWRLGSKKAVCASVRYHRLLIKQAVEWYVRLLRFRRRKPRHFQEWQVEVRPEGDLFGWIREGTCASDCTRYWKGEETDKMRAGYEFEKFVRFHQRTRVPK